MSWIVARPLTEGVTVEGVRYQPMLVAVDRVQGANAWLSVGISEGKNREIRRAMAYIGLTVNRLIRTSYGQFRLGELPAGGVAEVRAKALEALTGVKTETPAAREKRMRSDGATGGAQKRSADQASREGEKSSAERGRASSRGPRRSKKPGSGAT